MKNDTFFDSGFEDVDQYQDLQGLILSLDLQQENKTLLDIKEKIYQSISLNHGDTILDVGCGLGATVRDLAKIVGNKGKVIGIDKSTSLIKEAIKRTSITNHVEYNEGDVTNLNLEDESVSFVHAERVLMHVSQPKKALSEMIRVLKNGGKIAITEPDLTSVEIYPNYKNISKKVTNKWCSYSESPAIGRELLGYLKSFDLHEININVQSLLIRDYDEMNKIRSLKKLITALQGNQEITSQDATDYTHSLELANKKGEFLFYINVYTATATKLIKNE